MRVVVLGGGGHFGARICRRLAQEPGMEIIATSRNTTRLPAVGAVRNARIDIDRSDFSEQLEKLQPNLVIHCAGPFQGQEYRVALATLGSGAHYLDLADSRDFVAGFATAVDPIARAARLSAVSGASTLPALSSAVVDAHRERFTQLRSIELVIAPGQRTPRGRSTLLAVLNCAGHPFQWLVSGDWKIAHGWQDLERVRFSFGARWAAACDVPDLELFPQRYPGMETVTFRAAMELTVAQAGLWILAAWRRLRLPLPMEPTVEILRRIAQGLDLFGGDTGGMSVRLHGLNEYGRQASIRWEVVAKDNVGPEIPCMAAVLLARRLSRGLEIPIGAHACMGLLSLAEFESEFRSWNIVSSTNSCDL